MGVVPPFPELTVMFRVRTRPDRENAAESTSSARIVVTTLLSGRVSVRVSVSPSRL